MSVRIVLMLTMAGLAPSVHATPDSTGEMCAALERIRTAAAEEEMFSSLADGMPLVPGYRACRVAAGANGRILCHRRLAPAAMEADRVAAQVSACLGIAPERRREPGAPAWEFRLPPLWLGIHSHCDERCQVGRLASFMVRRLPEAAD